MFKSIQWRIGLTYMALVVVCMGLLSGYLLSYLRDYYLTSLESQLVAEARLVAVLAETQMASTVPEATAPESDWNLDALAKRLTRETNLRVTIVRRDGSVAGDSLENPANMENHGLRPEVLQALASGVGESRRYSKTARFDMLYVAVPIQISGEVAGVVRVSLPLQEVNGALASLARAVLLAIAGAAALAIILAIPMARATARPIGELTRMVKGLTAGNLDQKIRVGSQDEVGRLAEAFNHMSERLKSTIEVVSTERNRMAAILAGMADGIIITDGGGRVTLLSDASRQILRLPSSDSLGHSLIGRSLIEVTRDHELVQFVEECLSKPRQQRHSSRLLEVGMPKRFLRVVVTPIWEGGAIHALIVLQDLSEVRRAETARREFVANVSHELRTPLASIKALVETLRDGALEDTMAARDFLTRMEVEVDELTQLVRELLELSRIESGQVALNVVPTDAAALVRESVERLRAQAERAGVRLLAEVPGGLPPALADGQWIQQVLINLIHNAVKFTPAGGSVTVAPAARPADICVAVADSGVGIAAEDLPRIFERFYKADRSRSSGGTGLGLAVAKHIVQAHGGEIWARSEPGQGSTFYFTLPRHDARQETVRA